MRVQHRVALGAMVGLLLWPLLAWGQLPAAATMPLPTLKGSVRPETIAARKAEVQARLETLAPSSMPEAELEALRAPLKQLLTTLTALEATWQQRASYLEQIAALPQRLQELTVTRQALEAQPPPHFPGVSEELRNQYETRLQMAQAEIEDIQKQTATGDVRLAVIDRELEQRTDRRGQLEKALLQARSDGGEPDRSREVELWSAQLQLVEAEVETLQTEREWLSKRRPLTNALLNAARLRRDALQRALEVIKQGLGTTIRQEQTTLEHTAERLEQKLEQTNDPAEAMRLAIHLEAVDVRKVTADYRQQLNRIGDQVLQQEQRNARLKQDMERLAALVEKYGGGEAVAQRLLVAFERLQRERRRVSDMPVKAVKARLGLLTAQMLALDDQLYEFERPAEERLGRLTAFLSTATTFEHEASITMVRNALDEKKTALYDQQQVLTDLVHKSTTLLTFFREYSRLIEDSHRFVLTKMIWLRTSEALNWNVGRDMVDGALATGSRLHTFMQHEQTRMWASISGTLHLWVPILLMVPWIGYWLQRRLQRHITTALSAAAERTVPPGVSVVFFLLCKTAIWPAYLVLLTWGRAQFPAENMTDTELLQALLSGLQVSALIAWIGLAGRAILQRHGWGQCFWGLRPELCRFLRRVISAGCIAALLLLVPHHILRTAPGGITTANDSLVLARFVFLVFQLVLLVLVGLVGRRNSLLMATVLDRSRQAQGLLWQLWPLIYVLLLGAVLGIITIHVLGYFYAARYIWARILESLVVILVLQFLLGVLVLRMLHRFVGTLIHQSQRLRQRHATPEDIERAATIVRGGAQIFFALLAISLILELWGVSVTWLLTAPLTTQIVRRLVLIGLAVGLLVGIIQASNALTEYLIQPRRSATGDAPQEVSRQLRTLAPLIQTVIRVGAIFIGGLVILEQLGIDAAPILAGLGLFGLAVGLASQSLIKDVINGLFLLFEDSLSVGDVVSLRGTGGQVEKVTLRAVTIRDLAGNVHIIPNSTIDMVTNMTKVYSRYVLDVGVAYREDVDAVINILREIDTEMRRDPLYRRDMLEPLEVLGLERFDESAVVIRARLKTRPIQQWRIGREFNRRLKKVFDERGIEIPFPHRTLYWGNPPSGSQPPLPVAVEEISPRSTGAPGNGRDTRSPKTPEEPPA